MTKETIPEVSLKSTKDQILAAYNQAVSKLNEKKNDNPQENKQKEEKTHVVEIASKLTSESILKDLSNLKIKSIQHIDTLSENLLNEFTKLTTIRRAIEAEQHHLHEMYQIKETANTLAALIQVQAEEKEIFEREKAFKQQKFNEEMKESQEVWQKRLADLEADYKEKKESLEKQRNREKEDYQYTLEIGRRKEVDAYNQRKAELEKELEDKRIALDQRAVKIKEQEALFNELSLKVEGFSDVMKQAVAEAEQNLRSLLEKEYHHSLELHLKESKAFEKLSEQKISYLETKIKEQDRLIQTLTQKADAATEQVQSIANRALDTSVHRFVYPLSSEEKQGAGKG